MHREPWALCVALPSTSGSSTSSAVSTVTLAGASETRMRASGRPSRAERAAAYALVLNEETSVATVSWKEMMWRAAALEAAGAAGGGVEG